MEAEDTAPAAAATPTAAAATSGRREIARRAGVVSLAVLASRVLGLVREQVFAVLFGAGRELDAFITAFRIPNLLRDLFAEGALSAAFVARFTRALEADGPDAAWRLANQVLNALAVVVGTLTLLGIWAAPALVATIAPGFGEIPGKLELTIHLTRIMFPFLVLVAFAAVAMGILNTHNVFGIPAAAAAFFNVGSVLGGVAAAWWLAPGYLATFAGGDPAARTALAERAITGMAIGTLVGGALQLGVQVPRARRLGWRWRPVLDWRDPGLRDVMRLMAPATIGAAAVQVNVFVNSNFASYLGDGPVSWLNVAFRFMQLPIGLFGVAVGTASLPTVSRQSARGDRVAVSSTVGDALELVALLCLPAAVGLAVLGVPMIGLVYEHGRFAVADTQAAAGALAGYAIGLGGYAAIKVLAPSFYALGDARTPMLVSLLSIAVNFTLNWTFVRRLGLGHVGLALSTSAVALANSTILWAVLRRRIGPLGEHLWRTLGRIALATAAMGVAIWALDGAVAPRVAAYGSPGYAVRLAVSVPAGVATFAAACVALDVPAVRRLVRRLRV
jgi:putative peptidoglycan lipid II flippase